MSSFAPTSSKTNYNSPSTSPQQMTRSLPASRSSSPIYSNIRINFISPDTVASCEATDKKITIVFLKTAYAYGMYLGILDARASFSDCTFTFTASNESDQDIYESILAQLPKNKFSTKSLKQEEKKE
ncbi:MAG: hypothetical protein V4487_02565 [Chlamydiota bacterium]